METIKVQSQSELDAALERAKSEYLTIIVDSPRGVWLRLLASGSAAVRASGSATVRASAYVAVHLFSAYATVYGGVVIDVAALDKKNPKIWCEYTGTRVDADGLAYLYKAVDDSFNAGHNYKLTNYTPGTVVTAPDWEPGNSCGHGLHVCPRPKKAKDHFMEATKFVEVTVPVDEIFPIDWTKVKAQTVTCLREVTIGGEEVSR